MAFLASFDLPRVLIVGAADPKVLKWQAVLAERARVMHAASLAEAWELTDSVAWQSTPSAFAFVDLELPDGDGSELLERLASLEPRPAVAVLTSTLDARRALALYGRCRIVVPKPVAPELLSGVLDALEESISKGSCVDLFARTYGLSRQETSLVLAAVRSASNDEAARQLGCKASTVRTYWSRIFAKTQRRSVRDVLALLFRFSIEQGEAPSSGTYPFVGTRDEAALLSSSSRQH
jgi:DNA-binding NarL/FixJ family response regulator